MKQTALSAWKALVLGTVVIACLMTVGCGGGMSPQMAPATQPDQAAMALAERPSEADAGAPVAAAAASTFTASGTLVFKNAISGRAWVTLKSQTGSYRQVAYCVAATSLIYKTSFRFTNVQMSVWHDLLIEFERVGDDRGRQLVWQSSLRNGGVLGEYTIDGPTYTCKKTK